MNAVIRISDADRELARQAFETFGGCLVTYVARRIPDMLRARFAADDLAQDVWRRALPSPDYS